MPSQQLNNDEVKLIWSQVKEEIKLKISPAAFNTWILLNPLTSIEIIDQTRAKGVISSPSAFHATNLKKNLYSQLKSSIESIINKRVELDIRVTDPMKILTDKKKMFSSQEERSKPQREFGGFNLSGENFPDGKDIKSPTVEELFSQNNLESNSQDRITAAVRQTGLRLDYQFDSYAVSGSNEMAHAAATAVAKRPGQAYNPLFLYGGVGVGKTHLMQAIGHHLLKKDPSTKVIYCTGEEFTNDIIDAIRNKKASGFKKKFRSAQILLIDDIQFIAGKNAVQEEFFHTFNALIKLSSQIVLTSDRSPSEIPLLEDRLRSRFEAGLMVDIQQPSLELKAAIVLIKSKARGLTLPINLAEKIASKVDGARRIEGVITTIQSETELNKKEINENLIDDILLKEGGESRNERLRLKPQNVIKKVCNHYQISQSAIKGKRRNKEIVEARHMAMYILKNDLGMSYVEIGRWFSNRDHTSIMHAREKIEESLLSDDLILNDYQELKKELVAISK